MTVTHEIRIAEPAIDGGTAMFRWTVEPATDLYHHTSFTLGFPKSVDLGLVPAAIWWQVALICLHAHWPLLRPCRIHLPVRLGAGERELWMRFCDAQVATLEAHAGGGDTARSIEIVECGPPLAPLEPGEDRGLTAACFSGGRDSLTQLAMLQELGARPLLVTTTSPRAGSVEHETPRRRHVLNEVTRRRDVELVEVRSDFRSNWRNDFIGQRYPVSVNELTDTFLYTAAAVVVAVARGARSVYLASETEVQENAGRPGAVVEHKHFMYSAASQRVLSAILRDAGIACRSLTYPLRQFQVQRLLTKRYPDLRDLQYSCWSLTAEQSSCSRCSECRSIGFNLMAEGVSPTEVGIDVVSLLDAQADWRPGARAQTPSLASASEQLEAQTARCIADLTVEAMAAFVEPCAAAPADRAQALAAYARMRADVLDGEIGSEQGYRPGFLALLDPAYESRIAEISDEYFQREPTALHGEIVHRALALSDWITAPLRDPRLGGRDATPAPPAGGRPTARPPSPANPEPSVLAEIGALIPDPEPSLTTPAEGRILPVAETLLAGNELRYLSECVNTNWISSAGSFIGRFEAAFAEVAGCRYGVACSSGTTALHLALAAAGIGPGHEVIVPTFTMIASANAVGYVGAKPILVDSDEHTWNLDIERIVDSISPRTRAIMIVHTYGHPVDADAVRRIADVNGLVVIEDAAEAHGGALRGRPVGSLGDVATFSFYGNKILTTGEGGMVTTNDERTAKIARELRDHGFTTERHFWHRFRAFNFRMSNLQAAVGLAQVERLDEIAADRRRVAGLYREALAGIPGLELAPQQPGHEDAHWMFGCVVGPEFGCSRDELRRRLAAQGIETRCFFVPIHVQPAYLTEHRGRRHPVAEWLGRTGLYLPSGPKLTEPEIARVAVAIRRARPGAGHGAPDQNAVGAHEAGGL